MKRNLLTALFCLCLSPVSARSEVPVAVPPEGRVSAERTHAISQIRLNALTRISLGGVQQSLFVQGQSESKPVLLFLHGGPGVPIIPFVRDFDVYGQLQHHFVMVYWDQRGAGHSYHADIPPESMNIAQFLADTYELTEILRARFHTPKIYLVGHSWGSILGVLTVAHHPELFHAYVGIGQAVDLQENERASYQFALEMATKIDQRRALQQLTAIGPPPYQSYKEMLVERKWVERFGGGRRPTKTNSLTPVGSVGTAPSLFNQALGQSLDWLHGPYFSLTHLWDELQTVNLFQQVPTLEVPVYFLAGRHDYYAPSRIVQRYYQQLSAPKGKTFLWFEQSGHAPPTEEPNKFYQILVHRILPETSQRNTTSEVTSQQ